MWQRLMDPSGSHPRDMTAEPANAPDDYDRSIAVIACSRGVKSATWRLAQLTQRPIATARDAELQRTRTTIMAAKKTKKKTAPKKKTPAAKAKPAPAKKAAKATVPPSSGPVRLSKLSLPELKAKYVEVVQRETNSDNPQYLIWKIREAQAGRVRVGPSLKRAGSGPQQVLSLRMDVDAVPLVDGD
jgi:hypothetical protein